MDELVQKLIDEGILKSTPIIEAFRATDRAKFVPAECKDDAYADHPLPIGFAQTISQPYTVAFMLELLNPKEGDHILDVGSGSGWTTALLSHIVGSEGAVHGVEIIPELVVLGRANLLPYRFPHTSIEQAGNLLGLPARGPFHKILVSAAAPSKPEQLVDQLAPDGVMVIPIKHSIWKISKNDSGNLTEEKHPGFAFVPLT